MSVSGLQKLNHRRHYHQPFLRWILGITLLMSGLTVSVNSHAQTMQVPEVGAFLPSVVEVRPSEPMIIDGLWKISSINKMIRIDRGRAYAIDGWTHLFILKIKPGMVVIQNISKTDEGFYSGDDLPLSGPFKARLTGDRLLDVTVAGALGEVRYQLIPQQLDDEAAFTAAVKAMRALGR